MVQVPLRESGMHQLGRPNVGLENRGGPLGLGFNSSVFRKKKEHGLKE